MLTPPPPRDTAQKWLAFGAIVVVAVGVSFGSSALKSHLASTLPQPDPTVPAPYVSPRPLLPNVGYATDDEDEVVPANDPIPPADSVRLDARAIPAWGAFDTRVPEHAPNLAPLHSKAETLFAVAQAFDGDVVDGFVVCRARVEAGPQGFRTVRVIALLGRTPEVSIEGPKDAGFAFLSSPLTTIRKRDPVEIRVFTFGAQTWEQRIAKVETYGEELRESESSVADLDCRTLPNDALQARVADDAGRADAAIATLATSARVRADSAKPLWGYPTEDVDAAERAVGDVAALVGWADPRVKKRVAAVDAALAVLDKEDARVFGELRRTAGTTTRVGALRLTLRSLDCSVAPDACKVVLTVKNGATQAITLKEPALRAALATKDGPTPSTIEGDPEVAPGASIDATLTMSAPSRGPSIAQLCGPGTCGVIKLR